MTTQWIDWAALAANSLWVVSLSVLIALAGFRLFLKTATRIMVLLAWLFGALMCLGLALSLHVPVQKLAFTLAGVICAGMLIVRLRKRR
jgi:hypothetical protein